MLANVALSLGAQLKEATGSAETQEAALMTAGSIIARYVEESDFTLPNGNAMEPLTLKPELLIVSDSYPRLKFTVARDRINDAIAALMSIDAKSPTMPGLSFNQLVCCNEETCMIVLNAGAVLVCEIAGEIAHKIQSETPAVVPTAKLTPAV